MEAISDSKIFVNSKWFNPYDPQFTSRWIVSILERGILERYMCRSTSVIERITADHVV
jgi:hypothetical protein